MSYTLWMGALILATSPAVAASGAPVVKKPAAGDALPLSRDALFDLGPEQDRAQPGAEPPPSRDALFGLEEKAPAQRPGQGMPAEGAGVRRPPPAEPGSREALFGLEPREDKAVAAPGGQPAPKDAAADARTTRWQGHVQTRLAYTYGRPDHWSKLAGRLELAGRGRLGGAGQWKLSGRLDYDAVYDLTDHYQSAVRNDQRLELQLRETYVDLPAGGWEWRIGRQHVVWGEMVGLFFADVVSARDLREFILPDFESLRIPQWAVRGEYYRDDWHAELLWIPYPSYDKLGRPKDFLRPGAGADFYPYPASPPGIPVIRGEVKPARTLAHTNYGARVSRLVQGWDLSAFFYSSMNSAPTLYRDPVVASVPQVYTFTPRHDRIRQVGGTLAKDLVDVVLKAEIIYTQGRRYNVVNATDSDGVVKQNNLDWVVGLDFDPDADTRLNAQLFQRVFFDHHPDIVPDRYENGFSLLANRKLSGNWEAEALLIHSLNRSDWLLRTKAMWKARPNLKLSVGLDVFGGPPTGLFGQYDRQDRVYLDLRYDF
jgi:hypothetical protein